MKGPLFFCTFIVCPVKPVEENIMDCRRILATIERDAIIENVSYMTEVKLSHYFKRFRKDIPQISKGICLHS